MGARLVFMGTPNFAVPTLHALLEAGYEVASVVTQPDRPVGRGREVTCSAIKHFATRNGLPVQQPSRLRDPSAVAAVAALAPEVIVVAAYGLILPRSVLEIPPAGCLNVHGSLLPKYRGAAPIPAAILAGDEMSGVTIMLMDEGMDTGPILAQATCSIEAEDTTARLTARLAELGASCLLDTLPPWLAGQIEPRRQPEMEASYAPMLHKSDSLIDWNMPAIHVERQIRAYHPWPGSVTLWGGRRLKVLSGCAVSAEVTGHQPGSVVEWDGGAAVITGDGLLRLECLQLAGKRSMPVEDFLCGQCDFVGSVLGGRECH